MNEREDMLTCKNCIHLTFDEGLGKNVCEFLDLVVSDPEKCAKICPKFERKKRKPTKVENQ